MGQIKDPRIVGVPKNDGERMAINQLQQEQAVANNPMFGIVKELEERVQKLSVQYRAANIRSQALMDYMAHLGLILHQEIDDEGHPIEAPYTPEEQEIKLFERLLEAGIIDKMPTYGFTAFYVEHNARIMFLMEVMGAVQQRAYGMERAIELIDEFNNEADRIVPITGTEFGLDVYLAQNPEGWPDEKCEEIGLKFGLMKREDADGGAETGADEGDEDSEAEVVPFEKPSEGSTIIES